MMAGMIEQINQHVQDKFTITSMPLLKLPKVKNFEASIDQYTSDINSLMTQFGLQSTDSIGDYWEAYMASVLQQGAREFGYNIQQDTLKKLAVRWAYKNLTPGKRPKTYNAVALSKISELKNYVDNREFIQWVSATEKSGELKSHYTKMIDPLKTLFLKLGVELNNNISNLLTLNPSQAVQEIRQGIEEVTREIEATGDISLMDKLLHELKMINKLGGLDSIVPSEGLTFT